MSAIGVQVDLANLRGVQDALDLFRTSIVNRVVKNGSMKGARKTLPKPKSNIGVHKRTGQLQKALGVKYAGYKSGWTVLLGPRRFFRGSAPGLMSPNRTTIDPVKYAHLLEGGRGHTVYPKNGHSMPIFVKRLDPNKRRPFKGSGHPIRAAKRTGKVTVVTYGNRRASGKGKQDRARKVPGGWLLFTRYARPAPAYPWLAPAAPDYGSNIRRAVVSEIRHELPAIAADMIRRGKSPYRI